MIKTTGYVYFKNECKEIVRNINDFKYRITNTLKNAKTYEFETSYNELIKEHRIWLCKFLAMREACSWLTNKDQKIFLNYLKGKDVSDNDRYILQRKWNHLRGIYNSLTQLNIKKYC